MNTKRLISVLLAAALVVSVFAAVPAWAATRVVNDDGNNTGCPEWDTADSTHTTITAAVDAAADGDIILVCPGTYAEVLNITTNNLQILSTQGAAVTNINPDCTGMEAGRFDVWLDADYVTLDGFAFNGTCTSPYYGMGGAVRIMGSHNTVSNNTMIGNSAVIAEGSEGQYCGVWIQGATATYNTVSANELYDWEYAGIGVGGDPTLAIHHNTVGGPTAADGNHAHDNRYFGMFVDRSSDNIVQNNKIGDTTATTYDGVGIVVWGAASAGTVVDSNIIDPPPVGIALSSAQNVSVTNNDVSSCPKYGIQLSFGWVGDIPQDNTFTGNQIKNCGDEGVHITPGTGSIGPGNEFHLNNIEGNTNFGMNNLSSAVIDAEYNWWGADDGPSTSPGSGDKVSANVDYDPWLRSDVASSSTDTVTDGSVRSGDAEAYVDGGPTTVTVVEYSDNPGPGAFSGQPGSFMDVYVPDPSSATEIEVRWYYPPGTDTNTINMMFFDGTMWQPCSDQGIVTGSPPYAYCKVRNDTVPALNDLTRLFFGSGAPGDADQGFDQINDQSYPAGDLNPLDSEVTQKIELVDHAVGETQDADSDDVYITKIEVDNLGTATGADIDSIEILLDGTSLGIVPVTSFPVNITPPSGTKVADNASALLEVKVNVAGGATNGRTIRTRVTLHVSEGPNGWDGSIDDGAGEVIKSPGFSSGGGGTPAAGNKDVGDSFSVNNFTITDDPDANNQGLTIKTVNLTLQGTATADCVQQTDVIERTTGASIIGGPVSGFPTGSLTASGPEASIGDEGSKDYQVMIMLKGHGTMPATCDGKTIGADVNVEVEENTGFTSVLVISDTVVTGDEIRDAGLEDIGNTTSLNPTASLAPGGTAIVHEFSLGDNDRSNGFAVTVNSIEVSNVETIRPCSSSDLTSIVILDPSGNVLGSAGSFDTPIAVANPDGSPFVVTDDATTTLRIQVTLKASATLGCLIRTKAKVTHTEGLFVFDPYSATAPTSTTVGSGPGGAVNIQILDPNMPNDEEKLIGISVDTPFVADWQEGNAGAATDVYLVIPGESASAGAADANTYLKVTEVLSGSSAYSVLSYSIDDTADVTSDTACTGGAACKDIVIRFALALNGGATPHAGTLVYLKAQGQGTPTTLDAYFNGAAPNVFRDRGGNDIAPVSQPTQASPATITLTTASDTGGNGDANSSGGNPDITDARCTAQYALLPLPKDVSSLDPACDNGVAGSPPTFNTTNADVAPPAGIDITDARYIAQAAIGLITLSTFGNTPGIGHLTPGVITETADVTVSSADNNLSIAVTGVKAMDIQGRLSFDPAAFKVVDVVGVNGFYVLAKSIDNLSGRVEFAAAAFTTMEGRQGEAIRFVIDGAPSDISLDLDVLRTANGSDIPYKISFSGIAPTPLVVSSIMAYPNPVASMDTVHFVVEGQGIDSIKVEVFDLAGSLVFDSGFVAGKALEWHLMNSDGFTVANGVYLYVVTVKGYDGTMIRSEVRKLVVLR